MVQPCHSHVYLPLTQHNIYVPSTHENSLLSGKLHIVLFSISKPVGSHLSICVVVVSPLHQYIYNLVKLKIHLIHPYTELALRTICPSSHTCKARISSSISFLFGMSPVLIIPSNKSLNI